MKSSFVQRRIPTLLGIGILVASLVGGILVMNNGGPGVFAPRATAQTTPKNIKITNIKDTSVTISFLTDDSTAGFVKYGKTATDIKTQAGDDRDQLSGTIEQFTSHYITLRDLDADTEYHYTLGTGSVPKYDNDGTPFTLKTAKKGGSPTAAQTIFGSVNNSSGAPAEGAIVYLTTEGGSELSALVRSQGGWSIPLASARTTDLSGFMPFTDTTKVTLFAQGAKLAESATLDVTIGEGRPVPPITLISTSSNTRSDVSTQNTVVESPLVEASPLAMQTLGDVTTTETSPSPEASAEVAISPSPSLEPSPVTSPSPSSQVTNQQADTVDLTSSETQTVDSSKPTITGKAAPNSTVTIEIHSDNQIVSQVETDAQGNFTLPLSGGSTALEPGEHTAKITYTDPATGQVKTETKTFFVSSNGQVTNNPQSSSTLLAQANVSPTPYGTDNPYTIPSPSPSASASASARATASASPRVAMPATGSAIPKSGSVGMTYGLILGGLLLVAGGMWNFNRASVETDEVSNAHAEDDSDTEDQFRM